MRIGGFVKQSLIDYPGKIAAVVFTQGCNFRCGYCHNPQLVLPELFQSKHEFDPDKILNYLENRKTWLEGVVISGGEPTIHKDLPIFLKELKKIGYCVKLDTNGSNPTMISEVIKKGLVDYIAMDIKTILNSSEYSKIIRVKKTEILIKNITRTIKKLNNTNLVIEFRTTHIPILHTSETFKVIRSYLGKSTFYTLNQFENNKTINSYLSK
jgi:pyruvate formate lyase activating enzyme